MTKNIMKNINVTLEIICDWDTFQFKMHTLNVSNGVM